MNTSPHPHPDRLRYHTVQLLTVRFLVYLSLSHTVSWVRCGTSLYRFLIFAFFPTLTLVSKVSPTTQNRYCHLHTKCNQCSKYEPHISKNVGATSHIEIRKYHNHKLQTNPWHHEEEPHNNQEKPGKQTKQSNQLSLPHQDDCKTRRDIK